MNDAPPPASTSRPKLPEGVLEKPSPDNDNQFKEPVRWLLGDQIVADLKLLILHALYGSKLDSRDWMTPDLIRFLVPEQRPDQQAPLPATTTEKVPPVEPVRVQTKEAQAQALDNALRVIELPHAPEQCGIDPEKEFWFDYLADTGDGQRATYNVAYACMSHLSLGSTEIGAKVLQTKSADCEAIIKADGIFLPRGRFQFIGGDTSYNVAEYATLIERFQSPFCWAYQDLVEREYFSTEEAKFPRPLFGIPGNHDYYDALDGFNRQFRQPITEKLKTTSDYEKPLHIPAFKRYQEASYVALELPFGWWLWGLDTETDELDFRQKEFFRSFQAPPRKLIVATPAPTTHLGRQAKLSDKLTEIFRAIELELPFLSDADKEQVEPQLRQIPEGKCRLDLSGDIHHYVRYWGTPAKASSPWGNNHVASDAEAPRAENYASVMAGGGGASFHPSDTDIGEIDEQVLYPRHAESRVAVFRKLFNPWAIWSAGKVQLLGIIMACFICFAVTVPQSGRDAFRTFPLWQLLGVVQPAPILPTAKPTQDQINLQQPPPPAPLHEMLFGTPWNPRQSLDEDSAMRERCDGKAPLYFWGPCKASRPLDFSLGVFLVIVSLITVLYGVIRAPQIFADGHARRVAAYVKKATHLSEDKREDYAQRHVAWLTTAELYLIACIALLTLAPGILFIVGFRAYITPFGNSLLLFLTLMLAAGAVSIAFNYQDWRFKLISQKRVRTSNEPEYFLWLLAIGGVGAGFFFFGNNNLASYLASDIVLCLFLLFLTAGLILLAVYRGKELHGADKSLTAFLFTPTGLTFTLLGLWHAFLQLLVPLFLIHNMNLLALIYAAAVTALFTWLGGMQASYRRREKKLNNRATLLTLWFIFGSLLLLWPLALKAVNKWLPWLGRLTKPLLSLDEIYNLDWKNILIMLVLAAIIGAVMSCVWVGWYLAVMLSFNAHNLEAGGAARLEGFNQFIRIRLTEHELTAYVIGFNDAADDGRDLDLRLIDTFTIKPG
jgi:hypothetical protein